MQMRTWYPARGTGICTCYLSGDTYDEVQRGLLLPQTFGTPFKAKEQI